MLNIDHGKQAVFVKVLHLFLIDLCSSSLDNNDNVGK
jgi:hypothetical protein